MIQIVKLSSCIHLYDSEEKRFIKRSAGNLKKAIALNQEARTKREILESLRWQPCSAANCKVKRCKDGGHLLAKR